MFIMFVIFCNVLKMPNCNFLCSVISRWPARLHWMPENKLGKALAKIRGSRIKGPILGFLDDHGVVDLFGVVYS